MLGRRFIPNYHPGVTDWGKLATSVDFGSLDLLENKHETSPSSTIANAREMTWEYSGQSYRSRAN
jgi:hypothetical protein